MWLSSMIGFPSTPPPPPKQKKKKIIPSKNNSLHDWRPFKPTPKKGGGPPKNGPLTRSKSPPPASSAPSAPWAAGRKAPCKPWAVPVAGWAPWVEAAHPKAVGSRFSPSSILWLVLNCHSHEARTQLQPATLAKRAVRGWHVLSTF